MPTLIIELDEKTTAQEVIDLADHINCDIRRAEDGTYRARERKPGKVARLAPRNSLVEVANAWRKERGYQGGFVILYQGEVTGWKAFLERPESQTPGCIAIDELGRQWVAAGGDEYNGALRWDPVEPEGGNVARMPARVREVRQPGPGAA